MIELRLLEQALAVAERRGYAWAAHVLHISRPAPSRHVQTLEPRLGLRLFERSRRCEREAGVVRRHLARSETAHA